MSSSGNVQTVSVVNVLGTDFLYWLQEGAPNDYYPAGGAASASGSPSPGGSPGPATSPSPATGPSPAPANCPGPVVVLPAPTPTVGTPIIGGSPGAVWERTGIRRIRLGSAPRAGVALEVLTESNVNMCCYPGNLLRFESAGLRRMAVEMGGLVPRGRICAACIQPGVLTGAGRFTPDRPGKWTLFDRYTGVSLEVQVP